MKKFFRTTTAAALICALLFSAAACEQEHDELIVIVNPGAEPLSQAEMHNMAGEAAEAFYRSGELREELASGIQERHEEIPAGYDEPWEATFYTLDYAGKTMRFFMETIGEPDENGRYPLYITLHGGGDGPAEGNNAQWIEMSQYYKDAVENGIYIACRGITDTWDLHFQEESYVLYDRLIESMIVLYGADPNRVYLLGFSAGGDGVYQIAPRLAERFAAANMSSGHPNGVSLLNLANCPICLQTGIRDYYSEEAMRSVRTAEYEKTLSGYREQYGFGYEHSVWIHVPEGHNFTDNADSESAVLKDPAGFAERAARGDMPDLFLDILEDCGEGRDIAELSYHYDDNDAEFNREITEAVRETLELETVRINTNAVRYVSQFTRNPAPEKIVWDLSTRAKMRKSGSFYWLEAGPSVNRGVIKAEFDAEANRITVEPSADVNGDFAILFHPALIDVSRPVIIQTGDTSVTVRVHPSREFLETSMLDKGDPELGCIGKIMYSTVVSSAR